MYISWRGILEKSFIHSLKVNVINLTCSIQLINRCLLKIDDECTNIISKIYFQQWFDESSMKIKQKFQKKLKSVYKTNKSKHTKSLLNKDRKSY